MAARKLEKTSTPSVFRRHKGDCPRGRRCDCAYVIVWRYRDKQHTESHRTYAEATEALASRKAGDRRPTAKITFSSYFDQWIESYAGRTARGFSETSRALYRRAIVDHALPAWGGWRLADVEPADVRDLFGGVRARGGSTPQLKTLRAALSALFSTAAEDGDLSSNPVRGVRIPNGEHDEEPPDDRAKALTREELAMLLAAVPDEWRLFFEFLAATGLRISEAVGLRWEHLDLGGRPKVLVREQLYRGKRKRLKSRLGRRDVPLSKGMGAKLIAHRRDTYKGAESPVFATTTGTPLDPHNVRRQVLRPAALSLGFYKAVVGSDGKPHKRSTLGFHALRHTCASMLFEQNRNVRQVSEWLGHADPAFTLREYVHLMDEGVGEGLDLDAQVNTGSTRRLESAAKREAVDSVETAQ
jgi:integrase